MCRGLSNLLPPPAESERFRKTRELLEGLEFSLDDTIEMVDEAIGLIDEIRDELRRVTG